MDSSQTLTTDNDTLGSQRVISGADTGGPTSRVPESRKLQRRAASGENVGTENVRTTGGGTTQANTARIRPVVADDESISGNASVALRRMYGPILGHLTAVERCLTQEMQSPYEDVSGLLRHGIQLGGKRLRPAIHLLVAESLGQVTENHVVIGAVLEMVHTATLIHDDVLDEAQTRRHVPTINANWNEHTSILLGDYLFAQSFRLAASLGSTRTCSWVGEAARLVCEGELRQVLTRNHLDLDETTYFEMIQGKTAELCRVATSLAAAEAGLAPDDVAKLAEYGNSLGIAFQIADDYLDLWGDDETVGKTLGTDLEQGKVTLPVIRLLEVSSPSDRIAIEAILSGPPKHRAERLRPMLEDSDAKQYTADAAKLHMDKAVNALSILPHSDAKNCLIEIAGFSIRRSF